MNACEPLSDVVSIRRDRLRLWIAKNHGGSQVAFIAALAERGNEINQGELSGLLKTKSFGEKKARKLELMAGMPIGYLDGSTSLTTYTEVDSSAPPIHKVEDNRTIPFPKPKPDKWTQEAMEIFAKLNESQRAACVINLRAYLAAVGPPRHGQAL